MDILRTKLILFSAAALVSSKTYTEITIQNNSKFEIKVHVDALINEHNGPIRRNYMQSLSFPDKSINGKIQHDKKHPDNFIYVPNETKGIMPGAIDMTTNDKNHPIKIYWEVWAKVDGTWAQDPVIRNNKGITGDNIKAIIDNTINDKGQPVFSITFSSK